MVLTFSKLTEQRAELQVELARLKAYFVTSAEVPMTLKLVEFEIDRILTLLSGMEIDDIHKDDDGILLINQVCADFELKDANSVEQFCEMLLAEHQILTLRLRRVLAGTIKLILKVVNCLKQEISRGFMATTDLAPKPASEVEVQGSESSPPPEDPSTLVETMEGLIDGAIKTAMKSNPNDFNGDRVLEILKKSTPAVVVDSQNFRELIFQKCAEAVESGSRKSAQDDDQGQSDSKDDDQGQSDSKDDD